MEGYKRAIGPNGQMDPLASGPAVFFFAGLKSVNGTEVASSLSCAGGWQVRQTDINNRRELPPLADVGVQAARPNPNQ